jgi:ribose transport system substrate-binding protein
MRSSKEKWAFSALTRRSAAFVSVVLVVSLAGIADGDAGIVKATGIIQAKRVVALYSRNQGPLRLATLTKTPPTGKTVAWVFCTLPSCQANAAAPAAAQLGWKFDLYAFDLTKGPAAMAEAFDRAIAAKPDYIGFPGIFPDVVVAKQLSDAKAANIPVVKITGDLSAESAVVSCVQCSPQRSFTGKLQADVALADAGTKTSIVYAYDPVINGIVQSYTGAAAEVKRNGAGSKFAGVRISVLAPPAETAQIIVNYLRRHPDVKYVLAAIGDPMTAVPNALKSAGLSKKVKLIYSAPQAGDMAQLRAGIQFATVADENIIAHWRAIDALAHISVGEEAPKLSGPMTWHQIITSTTARRYGRGAPQAPGFQQSFFRSWRVG